MAHYYAIGAISQALREVLLAERPREFPNIPVDVYRTKDFDQPFEEGVSIYLYRLSLTTGRRNRTPYTDLNGVRHKPPVEVDLHFTITPWAREGASQQFLLGWIIRTIEDHSTLDPTLLNAGAYPNIFKPDEPVELVQDTLSISDLNNLWNFSPAKEQASAFYTARTVALESRQPLTEAEPVRIRHFDVGQVIA